MSLSAILLRAGAVAVVIALIIAASGTRHSFLAGLLLFFPVLSVPSFYFIGSLQGPDKMREAIVWGAAAVPIWLSFAGTLYWASFRMKPAPSLLLALGVWIVLAGIVVAVKLKLS